MALPLQLVLFVLRFWQHVHVSNSVVIDESNINQFTTFREPEIVNFSEIEELHIFGVSRNISIDGEFSNVTAATMTTRVYCYSTEINATTYNDSTCGIPGPTWLMTPNTRNKTVYLHNYLFGIGKNTQGTGQSANQNYKDCDVINVHTHGLHVSPLVDDVVDVALKPKCPRNNATIYNNPSDYECIDATEDENGDYRIYGYNINTTHYPGSHWYHAHWHGSTALHVNGGMYGAIKIVANDSIIPDVNEYEPQIPDENDHVLLVSYLWVVDNSFCDRILNNSNTYCTFRALDLNATSYVNMSDYVNVEGFAPFLFAVESYCFINCKLKNRQPKQYENSGAQYNVQFTPDGPWAQQGLRSRETFLVNGQAKPVGRIKTGEWHRLRIVNTNMAYLIWQINVNETDLDRYRVELDECQAYLISTDGIYFSDGPRLIYDAPYHGAVVIPPGGRADVMLICLKPGLYTVVASNNARDTLFSNAPLPRKRHQILRFFVQGNDTFDSFNVSDISAIPKNCTEWNTTALPCSFIPYEYSPYLVDTQDETYPELTSFCTTGRPSGDKMTQCNIVLQKQIPGNAHGVQVSVNHIKFEGDIPLLNIEVDYVHEWLVTSNFHQFHQHIWPFQMQNSVVDGWLAQQGDWRDTVGAPGSYIGRSRLVGGFDTGKLVQHCHFVPHEDHGLMAYHELHPRGSLGDVPINPGYIPQTEYRAPNKGKWIPAENCTTFGGISYVYSYDSQTFIIFYFKQFVYQSYCFFGYLPTIVFRQGHVNNAWLGLGLWGAYQDDYKDVTMDGDAIIWSLQAENNTSIKNLYFKEVELNSNHSLREKENTPMSCSDEPIENVNGDETYDVQIRHWYCVRPRTKDYPPCNGAEFDPVDYLPSTNNPFGYAFAYGEGVQYFKNMHASRGTCGMYFDLVEEDLIYFNTTQSYQSAENDDTSLPFFGCFQQGQVIGGADSPGQVSTIYRGFNITVDYNVSVVEFIKKSGFNVSDIPNDATDDDDDDEIKKMYNFFGTVAYGLPYLLLWVVYVIYNTYKLNNQQTSVFQRNLLYLQSIGVSLGTMFFLSSNIAVSIQQFFMSSNAKNPGNKFDSDDISFVQYITLIIAIQSFVFEQFSSYSRVFLEIFGASVTKSRFIVRICIVVEFIQFITYSLSNKLFINIIIFAIFDAVPHTAIIIIYIMDLCGKDVFPGRTNADGANTAVEMQQQQQQRGKVSSNANSVSGAENKDEEAGDLQSGNDTDAYDATIYDSTKLGAQSVKEHAKWGLIAVSAHLVSILPLIIALAAEASAEWLTFTIFLSYLFTSFQFYCYKRLIWATPAGMYN